MQTILITGANRGLGLEFVRQFVNRGERVFATARKPESADDLNSLAAGNPDLLTVVQLDAGDPASVEACRDAVAAHTDSLDVLVNNAGRNLSAKQQTIGSIDADMMLELLRTNTVGPLMVTQAFLPLLKQGTNSRVVNISSGMGSMGLKLNGMIPYSTSKAALNMVSHRMGQNENFQGITVIALDPGWVKTDMGGKNATFDIDEAVRRNIKVIDQLNPSQTGRYFNLNGNELPW